MNIPFIEPATHLGNWDISQITSDIESLFIKCNINWTDWKYNNVISSGKYKDSKIHNYEGNVNLTSNNIACPTLEEKLFSYAGRRFHEDRKIIDHNLYQLIPELKGTYTEGMFNLLTEKLGPIRMRLFNKTEKQGLYWHKDNDKLSTIRYHLVLWTNPGHFLVWTDKDIAWRYGYSEKDCMSNFNINAKFIPADGNIYGLQTGTYVHGVVSIGVGYEKTNKITSRCHLVISQIDPRDPT